MLKHFNKLFMKFSVFKILAIFIVFFSYDSFAQERSSKIRKVENKILIELEETSFVGVKKILFRRSVYLVSAVKIPMNNSSNEFRLASLKSDQQVLDYLNNSTQTKSKMIDSEGSRENFGNNQQNGINAQSTMTMNNETTRNSSGNTAGYELLKVVEDKTNNQKIFIFYKKIGKR
jgi:hypothetical protein